MKIKFTIEYDLPEWLIADNADPEIVLLEEGEDWRASAINIEQLINDGAKASLETGTTKHELSPLEIAR